MKSSGVVLRGLAVSEAVGRLLLLFIGLLWVSVSSVWADEIRVNSRGDYGNISVMELSGDFDANLPDGTVNTAPRAALAKEFYRTHQDDYDFLIFFTNFDYQMPGSEVAGFYSAVKNDTRGLGLDLFDHSAQFGSDGHLQGTIDMRSLEVNGSSPLDPDYTHTLNTLEHEILHRWSAHAKFLDPDGNISEALLGPDKSHWSYLLDTDGSLQYGNDWRDNGDGTFTSVAIRQNYSPLDLYLMGMIDKSAVPPMLLIDSPALSSVYLPKLGDTISGTARTVTIEQIIAALGERLPSAAEAPKSFKAAFIFVTRPDSFNGKELASLEAIRNGFLTRFSILTDGQGLVQVTPTLQPDLPVNPGVEVPQLVPRTLPPSLEEGVAWLRTQQQESGRWSDVEQTAVRDTTEALAALGLFGADPGLDHGAVWLTGIAPDSTDYLARRLEALALAGAPIATAVADLFARQNPDGGWGSTGSYQSSSTDTSLALRALVRAGQQQNPAALRAAVYLAEHQNDDGGWGGSEAFSMVQPSAHSLVALNPYENYPQILASLERGKSFLLAKQNSDGGFGNSPSTIYDSSAALLALGEVGASAVSTREAVTYLENRQFPDGSWYDSPFQTAAAVQALWRATLDPDLAVSSESISLIPEQISHLPTEQVVRVVVDNLGRTDVQQATVALYEGAVDAEHLLLEQTAAFPGLGSTTLTFPLTLDVARTYSLIVVVDPKDLVAELDEANNRIGKTLTVEETHDFAFTAEGVRLSKTDLLQGEGVTITAQLFNYGTVAAYSVPVRFYLSDSSSALVDIATLAVDLPAGKQTTVELFWYASTPGDNLQVVAEIDHNHLFAELDETNNLASASLRVAGSQLPNLAFASEPQFSNAPALQDKATEISVTLLNTGSVAAENVILSYYLGAPEAGGVLLGTLVVPEISAGERAPVAFTWSEIPVIGEQLIVVRVDVEGTLVEVDENDNQTLSRLMVLSRPDLVLAPVDVTISPSAPREGEAVQVTVNLYNNGQQDAVDIELAVELDGTILTQSVPFVAGNGWTRVDFDLGVDHAAGVHQLQVTADPADLLRELSEENNSVECEFAVQNADLWLSEPYFSPNGDGVKDVTSLYYRFATPQQLRVQVRDREGEPVRRLVAESSLATLDGSLTWDGRDERGMVVADGNYRLVLLSAADVELGALEVTLDTNRSSLFDALGSEFLLDEALACDLPRNAHWDWLADEERLIFAITGQYPSNYETGIYAKDWTSGEVNRLVPDDWISANPLISYTNFRYVLSKDRTRLALVFDTRDTHTQVKNTELWVLDSHGNGLQKMRVYSGTDYYLNLRWSPTGRHLLFDSRNVVEVVEIETQSGQILDIVRGTLAWSPDGTRILNQGITPQVIDLDGTVHDIFNDWAHVQWLNDRQIIAISMFLDSDNDTDRERYIWLLDADGLAEPKLITDDYSHGLVLAPDRQQFALVEGFSEFNGVKKVVLVDAAGDKSVIHKTPYEEIDYKYSHLDSTYGMGIISNLLWSPDGKILAYVDRLATPIGTTTYIPELFTYTFSAAQKTSIPLLGCSAFKTRSCMVDDNCWQACVDAEPQPEMDRVKALGFWAEDNQTLVLQTENSFYLVDRISGEKRPLPFEDLNISLAYSSYLDEILYPGETCKGGDSAAWRFASLQNLTADLRLVRERSAIELYGTAADLNFADYRLEFADTSQPDHWLPIQPPVSKPVLDNYLTPWVPPYPGTYFVRLSVTDRAGNTGFSRKRINWSQVSALSDFYRSTDIFSPNGDGVLDSLELSYRVVTPIQFTAEVKTSTGDVVRRIARSYSQPQVDGIIWDGRDEAGQVVPDGDYELHILDFTFPIEVDTTLPEVSLTLTPGQTLVGLDNVSLEGTAADLNLTAMWIEKKRLNGSSDWSVFPVSECDSSPPGAICRETEFVGPAIGDMLRFQDYRLVAKDRAGNTGIVVVPKTEPRFSLDAWGTPDSITHYLEGKIPLLRQGDPQRRRVVGYTTLNEDWTVVGLQYWVDGRWYAADADPQPDPQSGSFSFLWNATPVLDKTFKLRLQAVNTAGEVRLSNEYSTDDMFGIENDCSAYRGMVSLFENLQEWHLQVVPESILAVILDKQDPPLTVDRISQLNKEEFNELFQDLPASVWEDYLVRHLPEEIPGNVYASAMGLKRYDPTFHMSFPENAGEHYLLRMLGTGENGRLYTSAPVANSAEETCIVLRLYRLPESSCSTEPAGTMNFYLDEIPPSSVYVFDNMEFFVRSDDVELQLKTWNPPFPPMSIKDDPDRYWGLLTLDLTKLPPGQAQLVARLNYLDVGDGRMKSEETAYDFVVPDGLISVPQVTLETPRDGIQLNCRTWRLPDGSWRPMSVEADIAAASPLQNFDVCYRGYDDAGIGPSWYKLPNPVESQSLLDGLQSFKGHLSNLDSEHLLHSGASALRLIARDQNGLFGFDEIGFAGSNELLSGIRASLKQFSPNEDGVKDEVVIYYHLAEDAQVSIQVTDGALIDAALLTDQLQLAGDHSFVWRGFIPGLGIAADGDYGLKVSAADFCGSTQKSGIGVSVDTVAPVLEFTRPLEGSQIPVGKVVEVTATTDEQPLAGYNLVGQSIVSGAASSTTLIFGGQGWPAGNRLGNWQTSPIPGPWLLTLEAEDEAGNKGATTSQVDLVPRPILFSGMVLDPVYLSPNGDGRQDQLLVQYDLRERAQVRYEVLDRNANVVYTSVLPEIAPGPKNWSWDGLSSAGAVVADGAYSCRLSAALVTDPNLTQVEELTFVVDSTAPTLAFSTPSADAFLSVNPILLSGVFDDINMLDYSVEVTTDSGMVIVDSGLAARPAYELSLSEPLEEGVYHIKATTNDLAGNRSELSRTFSLDRTPPLVELQSPSEGAGFGIETPLVAIAVTINEEHLAEFQLRYGPGDDPQLWQTLQTSGDSPVSDVGFDWSVGLQDGPPDGRYTLSLLATDRAGLKGEARRQILIDNHPPTALIDLPADGALFNDSFTISGTAADGNFKEALLELSPDGCTTVSRWSALQTVVEPLENSPLAGMSILPTDGDYCLRLTVTDLVGNSSQAFRNMTIDTTPPEAPVLGGSVVDSREVHLSWVTSGEPEIEGFYIYRDETQVSQQPASDKSYSDNDMLEGEYAYYVQAFDRAGNLSTRSNTFIATVDRTPPVTKLSHPADAARVGDLIDIRGTAYSEDDFSEYRISYGLGEQPLGWTELRRSPVPVSGSRLVQWDSWGLPDGLYRLRLEAEDLSGNLAVDVVQVEIDNTPPQAPTLNIPDVLKADVSLTWEPNPETDIAGYLLYRNGRLVNAAGIVIGSLTPYLLNELDYQDVSLKDGSFVYTLVAVDLAGNQSLPSQEREVEVDTRAPRAVIVEPAEGASFEEPISVAAASEDMDIASLQFQYRPVGSDLWLDLGAPFDAVPCTVTLDPDLLSLSFGELELRALATDRGGQIDPDPAVTRIEYRDMTPPAAPLGLTVSFDCDEVALHWSVNTEVDLAGYNVYRKYDNDYLSLQNSQPLQAPPWINVFGTGDYVFVVKAVDQNGNESLSSETVSVQLKTPVWGSTEELTIEQQLDLSGTEAYPNTRAQLLSKGTPVAESQTDNTGFFAFAGVPLVRGENEFSVVAIDNEGNRSCASDSLMINKTILLPPPEGLQAQVSGLDVQLSWQPVVDPEMGQYYVYRDGSRLELSTQLIAGDQMTAYSDSIYGPSYTADMAVDGSYGTGWYSGGYQYGTNKWLEIGFDQPKWVNGFYVRWPSTYWQGVDFEFQVWDGTDWQTFFQKTGNTSSGYGSSGSAYLTDKVRLLITGFNNSSYYVGVTEFQIYEKPAIDLPSYLDSVSQDGQYTYQVSSVNSYGMEGPLSEALSVAVGDVIPPEPPVNLSVTALPAGRALQLTWEAGSTDTDHFTVYRADSSGGPYAMVGTTAWDRLSLVDMGLTNGTPYYYVITASDQLGNESGYSLEASGTPLDLLPPEPPSLFYPTVPGVNQIVDQGSTLIRGLTEPGARVQLFQDGLSVAEILALAESVTDMVEYDFSGDSALVSPAGDYLTYLDWDRYDGGLILHDIKSGDEILIEEGVDSFVWTDAGQQIVYLYEDQSGDDYLVSYQLATGDSSRLTTASGLSLRDPSTSADGNILAYVKSDSDAVWVLDRLNGTSREIFAGSWPENTAVTPDGTKVAYYDDDYGVLYVTDLASSDTVEVDLHPSSSRFEWSPDSRYLAYFSYTNSDNKDIYVFDSETTHVSRVTDVDNYKNGLHWSPDGKTIVYRQETDEFNESLRIVSLTGEQSVLVSGLNYASTLQWQASGEVVYVDDDSNQVNYLLPPGTFTFDSVSLNQGENQFYANATDSLDRLSPMSDSISLIYDTSRLPDIAVAENEVFLVPSVPAPGEQVVANVLVRNNTGTAAQNVKVDLYLWDSQANLEFLESRTITQLDVEGTATLSFSFTAPDLSGRCSLLVVADPENRINELIESNNFAERAFQVTSDGGVKMSIALNREAIASQQDLEINLELLNNGQAVDGRLEMKILDQSGQLVELLSQAEARLAYGLEQFDYVWNTGVLFAGEYQVWSGLYDNQGQLLVEQLQPFSILPDRSADLSLTTNSSSYGANEPVLLEIDVQNSGANDILSNLQLKTIITDISGQELFSDNQPVSQLLPGMSGRFSAAWDTARHAPGDFNVKTELWLENEVLQSETGSFKINPVSRVSGDLKVEPQAVVYGLDFKLPFAVANSGNQTVTGQLRVDLFDPDSLGVVATADQEATLSIAGNLSGEFALSSMGLKLQSYRVRLFHVAGGREQLISEAPFKVIDGRAPELEVKSPLVGETYRQLVNIEVVARDDISGVASVSYRLDAGAWQLLPFADLAAGRFAMTWHPALKDNGEHSIEFSALDNAGNETSSGPIAFELQMDVTPPVTRLETGLPYYKSTEGTEYLAGTSGLTLLATDDISGVALTEYRCDSGEWVSYADAISLTGLADGEHLVGFRSSDVLGNVETEKLYNFVIDNTPPVITIVNPLSGEFYNSEVLPRVEINDLLPTEDQFVLFFNGAEINNISPVSDEGEYRLDFTAVDSLGNTDSASVSFTIDKTPPLITTSGFSDGAYYRADVTPELQVTDAYLANSSIQVNGSDFVSGSVVNAEGQYELTASGSDLAGNTVAATWNFVIDKTSPESRLEFGLPYYQTSGSLFVSPQTEFSLTSVDYGLVPAGIDSITYAFAPNPAWNNYVDVFSLTSLSEGDQVIHYRASDRAGNLEGSRSLSVVLDSSAPATELSTSGASFVGTEGALFASGVTNFELVASDNLSGVARTVYRLDAGSWVDYSPFTLTGLTDGQHLIRYRSVDHVANEEPERTLMVSADSTAPVTNISVEGQQYTSTGNLYVTAATSIALNATDNLSGVASTEYRIDGGTWSAYVPFALAGLVDGQHVIGYRSMDRVANVETEQELTVIVDNTAPLTDITPGDPQFSSDGVLYVSSAAGFTLSTTDDLSGVKQAEYRIDNGVWTTYAAFTLAGLADGQHSIAFRSTDKLGNTEEEQSVSVIVDNSPPVTEIAAGASKYVGVDGLIYVTASTEFILTASDNLAGVAATEYRLDTGAWTPYVAFRLNGLEDGAHSIAYRSTDSLGNQEQGRTLSVVVDNTAPVTEISTGTPQFTAADATLFVSSATEVTLSAADNLSGVATTEYRIDEGVWSAYSAFTLNGLVEGAHSIAYRSIDSLGNIEETRSLAVVLDDTAAVTEIVTGTPQFTSSDVTLFVSGATGFTLTSTDNYSGVAATEYRVDGGAWSDYAPFNLNSSVEGAVVIGFRSMDNLGHLETEQSLNVVVDNSPPVTSIAFNNQSYMGNDQLLVTRKTGISLTAVDSLAGVADTFFRFDDQPGWQPYSGVFRLDALAFGSHAIHFRSVDHVLNMESESSVEFVLIGVESNTSVVNVPRVLIWLGEEDKEHKEDKDRRNDGNGAKDEHVREHDHEIDRSRQDTLDLLTEAFAGQDVYSQVVTSETDYRRAFRSGVFNLTLILTEKLPFGGDFVPEFVEGIRRGMGLLFAPGKHDGDSSLEDLLGVKFKGQESNKEERLGLQLYAGPVSEEGEVGLVGSVLKSELAGGTLAALIPGETSAEAIKRMTLRLPLELHDGDVVKVSLLRRHDHRLDIVDEEWITIDEQERHQVNRSNGNVYGDLSLNGHDDEGLELHIASNFGAFTGVYELDISVITHDDGEIIPLAAGLVLDWETHWSVGAPVGICRVTEINDKSKKKSQDLPGVVLHQFGEGNTAFLAFDLVASAKTADRSTYLTLVQNALNHLVPDLSVPQAASTELLETALKLSGSAIDLVAIEHLWPGLTYRPLFDHRQELLEYPLSFRGEDEARYRYFVRSDDRSGTFGKETEVQFFLDGIATVFESYPYSFGIEKDSEGLLQDSIAWLDEMSLLQTTGSENDDDPEDDCAGKDHDHDDAEEGDNRFRELKEQLIKIGLMDKGDAKRLEKVISKVLLALSKFDSLPVDSSEPRTWLNDYLRIMEAKYDLSGGCDLKEEDDD